MQADEGSSKPRPAGIVNSDPLWAQGRARLFRDAAMNALRPILFALSLSLAMTQAHAADTTFDTATEALLAKSRDQKSGLAIHVNGQVIGAYVVEIGKDVIVAANREHSRIVIRRDRIDAVAGN